MQRELRTVQVMLGLYCRDHHGTNGALCDDCVELDAFVQLRLAKCPYQEEKPTCANCPIHCYKPAMRDRIRDVMRYAGPRMLLRHPLLAIGHIIDGRREAPDRPDRRST